MGDGFEISTLSCGEAVHNEGTWLGYKMVLGDCDLEGLTLQYSMSASSDIIALDPEELSAFISSS